MSVNLLQIKHTATRDSSYREPFALKILAVIPKNYNYNCIQALCRIHMLEKRNKHSHPRMNLRWPNCNLVSTSVSGSGGVHAIGPWMRSVDFVTTFLPQCFQETTETLISRTSPLWPMTATLDFQIIYETISRPNFASVWKPVLLGPIAISRRFWLLGSNHRYSLGWN